MSLLKATKPMDIACNNLETTEEKLNLNLNTHVTVERRFKRVLEGHCTCRITANTPGEHAGVCEFSLEEILDEVITTLL